MSRREGKDDNEEVTVVNQSTGRNFIAHQELRPKFLDKDVDLMEMNSWIIDFKSYVNFGYNEDVPKKNLYIQLQPLLHESWKSSMDQRSRTWISSAIHCWKRVNFLCLIIKDESTS